MSHLSDGEVESDKKRDDLDSNIEFQCYTTDEKGVARELRIIVDEPVLHVGTSGQLNVLVYWPTNKRA